MIRSPYYELISLLQVTGKARHLNKSLSKGDHEIFSIRVACTSQFEIRTNHNPNYGAMDFITNVYLVSTTGLSLQHLTYKSLQPLVLKFLGIIKERLLVFALVNKRVRHDEGLIVFDTKYPKLGFKKVYENEHWHEIGYFKFMNENMIVNVDPNYQPGHVMTVQADKQEIFKQYS